MKKLNKLFAGFAAVALMASCSNDEPNVPTVTEDEGATMYLNINITDANSRSRADENVPTTGIEGTYQFGDADEHNVDRADFLFYDAAGRFITSANVWQADESTQNPNIEYMGTNTLVLRNLTKENLPVYMITVLNAPSEKNVTFAKQVEQNNWTMEETRNRTMSIRNGNNFIMSTTSFLDGDEERYDDAHYYATKLKATDFLTEVPSSAAVTASAVDVYVERLAAKFELTGISKDGVFPIEVTIAGLENSNNSSDTEDIPSASSKVYVKLLGYGLSGQEKVSYLSKNLDGFTTATGVSTTPWLGWNHSVFYRSYWGKSVSYGSENPDLAYSTFVDAKLDVTKPLYGFETTNAYTNIRTTGDALVPSKVTNMLLTARIYADEACNTALDLVEYNGVYYTKDQYIKYVLGKLQSSGMLEFWKDEQAVETTETTEGEEGTTNTTTTKYTYTALSIDDFTVDWSKVANGNTGEMVLTFTPAADTKIYKKGEDWEEGNRLVEASADDINEILADFQSTGKATAFRNGAMYYSIPVEHLMGTNQNSDITVTKEGEFGIVRNHWYQINVTKVLKLGNGVFYPGDIEGEETTEEIVPDDPKKERFALAAKINILSWKIVKQNVEL